MINKFDTNYKVVDNNSNKVLDSKVVFGKLMVNVRCSGEVVLTSVLGNITKTSTDNEYLYLYTNDESLFNMLSKKDNIDILNNNLKKFTNLKVFPKIQEKETEIDLKKILAEKFKGYFVE